MERLTETRTGEGPGSAVSNAFDSQAAEEGQCPAKAYEEYAKPRLSLSCAGDAQFLLHKPPEEEGQADLVFQRASRYQHAREFAGLWVPRS